jgi:hypothetical protein
MDLFTMTVLAQEADDVAGAAAGGVAMLLNCAFLIVGIVAIVGMWKTFSKAGKPGWAAIIPIYNTIVALEICGRPIWWIILFLIPCVGIVIAIIVFIDVAKSFGKGAGIGILMLFGIGWIILGFGDAQYKGPAAAPAAM